MKSMNKVQLIGYLGKAPDIKETKNGSLVASIRLATDTWIRHKGSEPAKYTDWHTIKVWGTIQVEKLRNYMIKGSHIMVEGRIVYRTYPDKSGHIRYITEIRAERLFDLDR